MRGNPRPFARARCPWGAVTATAALLFTGCGGGGAGAEASDLQVHGAAVLLNSAAPFTSQPDFPSRLEGTLTAALEYWGGSWSDLEHTRITFVDDDHIACGGSSSAIGCYEGGEIRLSTRDAGATLSCVEQTVLVHEVGHAIIGDPDHTDPRWMDFSSMAQALAGRPGYDASGEVPCDIYVSVWRHPPNSP